MLTRLSVPVFVQVRKPQLALELADPVLDTGRITLTVRNSGSRYLSPADARRSEEHTSELQSLMRISYAVFCLKKKSNTRTTDTDKRRQITITSTAIHTNHKR